MRFPQRALQTSAIFLAFAAVGAAAGQDSVDKEQMKIERQAEKQYTLRLETTQHKRYCKAAISIEYTQRDTLARVTGAIENDDCGASGGDYRVAVRFRDEAGEVHDVEFPEVWQRDDNQAFTFRHEYPIGDNMDLIRVRARKIQCICAEIPTETEDTEIQGEKE